MIKLKKKKIKISIIILAFILVFMLVAIQKNVGGLANKITGLLYHEYELNTEDILKYENSVKDIDVDEEGICVSKSEDSQIFISPKSLTENNDVKNIEIQLSHIQNDGSDGEYYLFNDEGEIINSEFPVYNNGSNVFDVKEGTDVIRLDITNISNAEFKIEKVIFNNNERLTEDLTGALVWANRLIICMVFALVLYTVFCIIKKTGILAKSKSVACIVCILTICFFMGIIYISNPWGISEKITGNLCISKDIIIDDFINNGEVHDFNVTDDKSLISINADPWLVLNLSKYNLNYKNIYLFNIVVDNISIDNNMAEIYYIDSTGQSAFSKRFHLEEGNNIIKTENPFTDISIIRLDLATTEDVEIQLDKVVINDNDALFKEFSEFISYLIRYIGLTICILLCYILGTYIKKISLLKKIKYLNPLWITANLVFVVLMNILLQNSILSYIIMGITFLIYGMFSERTNFCLKINKENILFLIIAFGIPILSIIGMDNYVGFFSQSEQYDSIVSGWLLFWFIISAMEVINNFTVSESKGRDLIFVNYIIVAFLMFFVVHSTVYCIYDSKNTFMDISNYIIFNVWEYSFMLNSLMVLSIYIILLSLGGIKFSVVISGIALVVSIIGNAIKLIYQGTYLKLADFLLINELFSILSAYVGKIGVFFIVLILLGIFAAVILNAKKIIRYVSCRINKSITVLCLSVVLVIITNNMGCYKDLFTDNFNLYEPENYDYETMQELISNCEQEYVSNDEKPDVILIMAESLFDINQLPNVSFNVDCTENIRKYQAANVISPRYGGGTAAVEFEALTGLTNYFFVDDMVAYNFYFSKNVKVNSIAEEFKNNGYETTAIHANRGSFYNRDMVYADMGFDKFYDISSFDISDEDVMNDGFTKDYLFFDKVKNTLEEDENPKFIFGVTIEGHSPYTNKFDNTDVKVESSMLSEREISDMEQYAQTIKDIDTEIEQLIEYLENRDRPTILYLWGDHLPPLSAFSTLGYVNGETYEKYMVPLVAYSNYKEIKVEEENISPTMIATQILKDSKISYSRYFDYIIDLQKKYPVIHKKFTEADDTLKGYYSIIYDLLEGKRYLLED